MSGFERASARLEKLATRGSWAFRRALGSTPTSELETLYRLQRLAAQVPRRTTGSFEFPFGALDYVDALSLVGQYAEIFVARGYDFRTDASAPRILDCGANMGLSVVRSKQQHPRARITAFEADPAIAATLARNLARLGLGDVDLVPQAVWDREGPCTFVADGADGGRVAPEGGDAMQAVRLADYVDEPVDLLKLDVEGAEERLITDLATSGKLQHVRRLVVEVHATSPDPGPLSRLLGLLAEGGFSTVVSHARPDEALPGPAATTPFPGVPSGKHLVHLHAWQPDQDSRR